LGTGEAKIKAKAQNDYFRIKAFDKRVRLIHEQLYAYAWYLAQIIPPPKDYVRQMQTTSARFLWEGDIFRTPLSTLYLSPSEGGWNFIDIEAKSRALL
jgi:hypothetical protein